VLTSHNRRHAIDITYGFLKHGSERKVAAGGGPTGYRVTGASEGSFALKHHFNSWLSSVISIPAITINLQLSISLGSSSSGSWQETRQYWHSWFQQNLPYGIVSGLMNWKQRSREFRSGT
jgi:hypothetical protein